MTESEKLEMIDDLKYVLVTISKLPPKYVDDLFLAITHIKMEALKNNDIEINRNEAYEEVYATNSEMAHIFTNAIAEAYPEIAIASHVDSLVLIGDKLAITTSRKGGFINDNEEAAKRMSQKLTHYNRTVDLMKEIVKNVEEKNLPSSRRPGK